MIKLIIFDLDGVLIESKDLHYEALNRSLKDFGLDPISYKDHVYRMDGKPTREKLEILNIDPQIHRSINERKQSYTLQLLSEKVQPSASFQGLFSRLKSAGYFIAIASNSIQATLSIVTSKLGLEPYIDFSISNEVVSRGKPNPEMYLRCMLNFGVGPRETLIIEDSYVGRQGVFNSGAYLCGVKDPGDVTYSHISSSIKEAQGDKLIWKGCPVNIVIPMAGAGSRFTAAGYTFPKPLIDIKGRPMLQWVIDSLGVEGRFIFLVRREHLDRYNLKSMLGILCPGNIIIPVDKLTEGAACTVLLASEYIDNSDPLIIANSDQFIEWDSSKFMYSMQSTSVDGGILTFENAHPKWSYVSTDEWGFATAVKEKEVISKHATVGVYYWSKGSDYVSCAKDMIGKNIRVNNEFYVAPVYNEAINKNKKIRIFDVESMWGLGTPEDLTAFLAGYNKGW